MLHQDIKIVAANLQQDIDTLLAALKPCAEALKAIKDKHQEKRFLAIHLTEEIALWAHYRVKDWSEFVEFASREIDANYHERYGTWSWSPYDSSPEPEVLRHRNRIDMALNLISKELDMQIPISPVPGHFHPRSSMDFDPIAHYERIRPFVQAANDILNPERR